jgi:hypothetical protein
MTPLPVTGRWFVTAQPAGFAAGSFRQQPCAQVSEIGEGDVIDLGDRAFEVVHLPGPPVRQQPNTDRRARGNKKRPTGSGPSGQAD